MKYIEYQFDYAEQKEFKFGLFSDTHTDAKYCEKDKLRANLDWCHKNLDGILLNGDMFSCLMPKDLKRFTLAHAVANRDDYLDYIIDYVADFYSPYADKIMFVGMGNHETSALKFHGTNPAARLCRQLKDAGGSPKFGDYQNIIRFKFHHGENSRVRSYDLWACHGMGAGAKRSRGVMEWDLVYSRFDANLYWMGHNHQAEIDHSGSYTRVNQAGQFVTLPKRGIRTPSWEQSVSVRDYNEPYDLKYGEERHGLPVALPQFGLLTLNPTGDIVKDNVCLMDI